MTDALGLGFVSEAMARQRAQAGGEPDWLLDQRLAAVRRYAELPLETNRLFTLYLDLRSARLADLRPWDAVGESAALRTDVPDGVAAVLEVRDDAVVARGVSRRARQAGVVVDTFANVLRERPALLRDLLGAGDTLPDDKLAQLAQAAAAVGVLVHIPAGVELAEPIVLGWGIGAGGRALVSRTVVSLGAGARASLLEEQSGTLDDGAQSLWSGTLEVILGAGATLDVAALQDLPADAIGFVSRHATIGEDATLRWALAHVGSLVSKSRVDNVLAGRGGKVQQVEIGFGGGRQVFDLTSYTRHVGRDTTGDLLSKGVFQDRARGFMKGLIEIEKSAVGTDSFLGEFGMLLDRKARSVTIPSLEIDQPDVRRASHSSSVGPIDESQVFYLMSRGVPPDLARRLIVMAFLEPVVARIPLESAQERLRTLLDRKWDQGRAAAADDGVAA